MNEPKRRGRPPKAAFPEGEIRPDVMERMVRPSLNIDPRAQAYALRVWNGQSPDVPRNERLRRVKLALEGQGLSMEGVEL